MQSSIIFVLQLVFHVLTSSVRLVLAREKHCQPSNHRRKSENEEETIQDHRNRPPLRQNLPLPLHFRKLPRHLSQLPQHLPHAFIAHERRAWSHFDVISDVLERNDVILICGDDVILLRLRLDLVGVGNAVTETEERSEDLEEDESDELGRAGGGVVVVKVENQNGSRH